MNKSTGEIVQIIGPVIDVEFKEGNLPAINDALRLEKKAEIIFNVANSYRLVKDSKHAEMWFRKAIKRNYSSPIAVLYLADALKAKQEFEEAITEYNKYKSLVPDDPRGDSGVEACNKALDWMEKPTRYKVNPMYYFNSRESDFAPAYGKDDYKVVIFTSSREGVTGNKISDVTGEYYLDLFMSRVSILS